MKKLFQHIFQFFIFNRYLSLKTQYFLIIMLGFGLILIFKVNFDAGLSFILAAVFFMIISYLKIYNNDLYEKIMDMF
ncbi:hypothetical protein [Lebetimonas natsushimae]|uniref:hypothetical protein n=1 Tax=Lebetimonas natsushimae TaxID=1936991 RepID=UPI000BB7567A|nr:hypothetical protein [Lebetimonas natsushimae]